MGVLTLVKRQSWAEYQIALFLRRARFLRRPTMKTPRSKKQFVITSTVYAMLSTVSPKLTSEINDEKYEGNKSIIINP